MTGEQSPEDPKVLFRVESGNPTPEEIAALTVVLAAAGADDSDATAPTAVRRWSSPARAVRHIGAPGAGAWRAEYAPR